MKDKFKQPKIDMTRYAVEVKGDITPTMGVDKDGTGKPKDIIGVNLPEGKGGGSIIVDALPAQGLEGSTYLLRKEDESKVFKAQAYAPLYHKNEEALPLLSMMIDPDMDLLKRVIWERLNPDLSNGLVDFTGLEDTLIASVGSSEEWNTLITSNKVAIVKTEEDVLNITEDVDYIFQDLGVIGIEDLNITESRRSNSETVLAELMSMSNNLCFSYIVQNDKVSVRYRRIVPASMSGTGKNYRFEDQQIGLEPAPFAGTLTDTYVYDQETLMSLEIGTTYLIKLTPMIPEYSYTQYVYDQGVYTVVGGDTGNKLFTVQIKGRTDDSGNYPISLTAQVETNKLTNFNDLQAYLEEKGYLFYYSSGEGSGFILQATGICSNYVITGIYTEYSSVTVICSDGERRPLRAADLQITYIGE